MDAGPGAVTALLRAWKGGDPDASEQLLPLVYRELRRQAAAYLSRERANHTLPATALVHEAYLRLVGQDAEYADRAHFFALAASMMRRVLVDHARARAAAKRSRPDLFLTVDDATPSVEPRPVELLTLDRALTELAALDPRQARIVELRYFVGLTAAETADVLGISPTTVKREWNIARAWLYRALEAADEGAPEP